MCLSHYLIQKSNLYFHSHGYQKNKKDHYYNFQSKFIECQSYHDIKGLVICMFSDYAHIDHIDYNEMCTYPFHQKEFLLSLVFLLGALF